MNPAIARDRAEPVRAMAWWAAIPNGRRPSLFFLFGGWPYQAQEVAGLGLKLASAYRVIPALGIDVDTLVKSHRAEWRGVEIQFWCRRLVL